MRGTSSRLGTAGMEKSGYPVERMTATRSCVFYFSLAGGQKKFSMARRDLLSYNEISSVLLKRSGLSLLSLDSKLVKVNLNCKSGRETPGNSRRYKKFRKIRSGEIWPKTPIRISGRQRSVPGPSKVRPAGNRTIAGLERSGRTGHDGQTLLFIYTTYII